MTRLVRGCVPSDDLLTHYNLGQEFGPLVDNLRMGYYQGYHEHLETLKPWFISFDCYSIMKYRLEIMFLRTLTKRA